MKSRVIWSSMGLRPLPTGCATSASIESLVDSLALCVCFGGVGGWGSWAYLLKFFFSTYIESTDWREDWEGDWREGGSWGASRKGRIGDRLGKGGLRKVGKSCIGGGAWGGSNVRGFMQGGCVGLTGGMAHERLSSAIPRGADPTDGATDGEVGSYAPRGGFAYGAWGRRDCGRAICFHARMARKRLVSLTGEATLALATSALHSLPIACARRSGPLAQSVANRLPEIFFGFRQIFACHTRSDCLSSWIVG
jgi:hypothetical protein